VSSIRASSVFPCLMRTDWCILICEKLGDVDNNLNRADAVLSRANPKDLGKLDLLVLPELCFSVSIPLDSFFFGFHCERAGRPDGEDCSLDPKEWSRLTQKRKRCRSRSARPEFLIIPNLLYYCLTTGADISIGI
jgi:hypothetical protein